MSGHERTEAVLAAIPGWQDAVCRELDGGKTNRSYLVEQKERQGVLKIDAAPRSEPFNTRVEEARIQKQAAAIGLAGDVIYVAETTYLSEWVEGRTWERSDLEDEKNLVDLALALRRLHSLPLTGRAFDAKAAAHSYLDEIGDADPVLAARFVSVIDAMRRPKHLCFCHNDLVAENIVATPEIRFLDWEYACDNDPFFDLATVVAHHELSNHQAELLLDTYFDGNGARWREHLADQERLYDALYWLWSAAGGQRSG